MRKWQFKNVSKQSLFGFVIVLTFAIGVVVVSFSTKEKAPVSLSEKTSKQFFFVEIPPHVDKYSPNGEIYEYLINYGIEAIPFSEFKKRNIPLPNVCGLITVSIKDNGKIMLYLEEQQDLEILKQRLKTIFQEREENGVYVEGSFKIPKKVIVKASHSAKYEDVLKVIDAVNESGADPIVLMIDEQLKPN